MAAPMLRRVRGGVLRLAQARVAAGVVGAILIFFSVTLLMLDFSWESWASDGLGLVLGGTGAALVRTAISGHRPDWIE
jgi:hypothetical protein